MEPIPPERMPALATEWLAAGLGGDAVLKAASSDFMDSRDKRDLFIEALKEVDGWLPSSDDAELALIEYIAIAIAQDEDRLEEQAQSFRRLLDFDEAVTMAHFPGRMRTLRSCFRSTAATCSRKMGGLPRMRKAVREIVEPSPSS